MSDFQDIDAAYRGVYEYCEAENFAGWDPFDGLNSRYFQSSPLRNFATARLIFLQIVKRSARNLRPLLKIEKGVNPKGIALFALAELARFRTTGDEHHAGNARRHLDHLRQLRIDGYGDTWAWGYNFDWQSRAFFAPRGTPTIVPTAFAAKAFEEAGEVFGDDSFAPVLAGVRKLIKSFLNRPIETDDEICFSYTPVDRSVIFNASLLAAEVLAGGDAEERALAARAARFVINRQRPDGAWAYGTKLRHAWIDNFHTAYILLSLKRLQDRIPDIAATETIVSGLDYWLANFFLEDGAPKYFNGAVYPIDIHSAAAAIVALCELDGIDKRCLPLAHRIASWLMANMRDGSGYFYYQKRRSSTVVTPFVRWSNAWTAYALARLLETGGEQR